MSLTLAPGDRQSFSVRATDPDDNLSSWEWFVDDLSQNRQVLTPTPTGSVTRTFSHTFPTAGSYTVRATFTDADGASGSVSWRVKIDPPVAPGTDSCSQDLGALTAAVTRSGEWNGDCAATHGSGSYARFYTFTLGAESEVTITLESDIDTYLYLLRGSDSGRAVEAMNDDLARENTNSRISTTLGAGAYTIEATTYWDIGGIYGATGEFTLEIVPEGTPTPPPTPPTDECIQDLGALKGGRQTQGTWTGDCASTNRAGNYAHFYSFYLARETRVQD